jgi:hypothetical protein
MGASTRRRRLDVARILVARILVACVLVVALGARPARGTRSVVATRGGRARVNCRHDEFKRRARGA